MRHLLFLLGVVLCALAFAAAAADMAAHGMDDTLGPLAGADQVWRTVAPETFAAWAQAWPQPLKMLLALPGWLTLGAPGLALVIFARAKHVDEDAHSLFLFDDLARQAREDGYTDDEPMDGMASIEIADKSFAKDDIRAPDIDEDDDITAQDAPKAPDAKSPSEPA